MNLVVGLDARAFCRCRPPKSRLGKLSPPSALSLTQSQWVDSSDDEVIPFPLSHCDWGTMVKLLRCIMQEVGILAAICWDRVWSTILTVATLLPEKLREYGKA